MKIFCTYFLMLGFGIPLFTYAQNPPKQEIDMDKFVQDLFGQQTANANYDNMYESVFQYYRYPLNLNTATREQLESLYILSPFQISSFLEYKMKNGKLLTIYELQAVSGFDRATIDKLLPFVTVHDDGLNSDARGLWKRLTNTEGNHYVITRYERTLEMQKGFRNEDSTSRFLGNPDRYYARYRAYQKNDFSAGLTVDKDIGEQFKWNPQSKQYGFDYYSAHLAVYNKGIVKSATIGDYHVQIGQGLVMAAGFYIGKGAETVSTVKRSNQGIRPYTAAMETGFLRGGAATISLGRFDWTNFLSYRDLDGNIRSDTFTNRDQYASSILLNGLHRTSSELANKGTLNEQLVGTHFLYQSKNQNLKLGINGIYSMYNPTIQKQNRVYNQFDFQGNNNYNLGVDFTYNWQNFSFFGEYSQSKSGGNAIITGFASSLSSKFDFSMLFRSFDRNFHSFYGNTFGELSTVKNERGIYWGIKYTPFRKLSFAAYFDTYQMPWLTSRSDAPSYGYEYLGRINWMPTRKITFYIQYRDEIKQVNQIDNYSNLDFLVNSTRRNLLVNLDYKAEKWISLKSRIQFTSYKQEGGEHEHGMAIMHDINFEIAKKLKISTRFAIFDANDYNTRLYVYEKNVLYAFALPLYYGQGLRNYILIQYKVNQNLDIWLRLAQFNYRNSDNVSSGLNEIDGKTKTDLTLQVKYDF
jgi:hypothetical protein